jgi:CBS domain-containing protein
MNMSDTRAAPVARDFMIRRVRTVRPDDRVYDVVKMLLRHRVSGAPVVDASGLLVGVLSEKDAIQALMRAVVDGLPSHHVRDVISTDLITVEEDTHLLTVAHLFLSKPVRRLPVVRDGKLVGQISRRDLLAKAVDIFDDKPDREAAVLYLTATGATPPR